MSLNKKKVIAQLNRILECELAGVVRYTHYSMMIFGYSRIPIVAWFQAEATESLAHAQQAGEMVTRLGGHPSLAIGPLLETHEHDIGQILRETLQAEHVALGLYTDLLDLGFLRHQIKKTRRKTKFDAFFTVNLHHCFKEALALLRSSGRWAAGLTGHYPRQERVERHLP